MKLNRFGQRGRALLVIAITVGSIPIIPQLPINESANQARVLAQAADGQIATRVYQRVNPAVVTIKTESGHGSGFIVSKDGLIVTNAHVVADALNVVTVEFADGRQVPADVLGFGKNGLDLAVVKVQNQKNLPTVTLARPDTVAVGNTVFAIGTPLHEELHNTLSEGIVSRIDKQQGIIQHTANINHGNSGGPLLNTQGEVVGINERGDFNDVNDPNTGYIFGKTLSPGIGFAMSVAQIRSFLVAVQQHQLSPVSTFSLDARRPEPTSITLDGQVLRASLGKADQLGEYYYGHFYIFQGRAGQKVKIEMDSQALTPSLKLYEVNETTPENSPKIADSNQPAPGNLNAQIITTLPDTGVYAILATSTSKAETGAYTLRAATLP